MRIAHAALHVLQMPLKQPFTTSFGTESIRELILVSVTTADGITGWGEVSTMAEPLYNYETTKTAWHILEDFLIPMVLGKSFAHPDEMAATWEHIRGHYLAKAGLNNAFWDAWAQAQSLPLATALGGTKRQIAVGVSVGIQDSVATTVKTVENYLAQGYQRIKVKIRPGWDEAMLRALRREFGPIPLMADANSAYRLADLPLFERIDDLGLMMIEQPLAEDDIVDHAQLQARLKTPICLDESILTPEDARKALDLGSCRIINVKIGRIGGHSPMLRLHDLCVKRGVPLWCGGMLESGVGRAHNIALTSLPGYTLPGDTSASDRYYDEDIVDPVATLLPGGFLAVPDRPGIGVTVLESRVAKFALQSRSYTT
ncbi:MAG TPA: o-succinylbenzoate synthase [Symbiobacteriaceae bacterium]|nr:o-succinylbenzoate synthase [Symbiobacteriaceae bacterium]